MAMMMERAKKERRAKRKNDLFPVIFTFHVFNINSVILSK